MHQVLTVSVHGVASAAALVRDLDSTWSMPLSRISTSCAMEPTEPDSEAAGGGRRIGGGRTIGWPWSTILPSPLLGLLGALLPTPCVFGLCWRWLRLRARRGLRRRLGLRCRHGAGLPLPRTAGDVGLRLPRRLLLRSTWAPHLEAAAVFGFGQGILR